MQHFAALGGVVETDQTCTDTKLVAKQLGTYTFAPHFSVTVPDVLDPVGGLMKWAKETYDTCDGESDIRACLRERKEVEITANDLYKLWEGEFGKQKLEMEFDSGVRAHAFTFGR